MTYYPTTLPARLLSDVRLLVYVGVSALLFAGFVLLLVSSLNAQNALKCCFYIMG